MPSPVLLLGEVVLVVLGCYIWVRKIPLLIDFTEFFSIKGSKSAYKAPCISDGLSNIPRYLMRLYIVIA